MKYTDETIMPFGKWKGNKLANVDDSYLVYLYNEFNNKKELNNTEQLLFNYIEDNLDVIE